MFRRLDGRLVRRASVLAGVALLWQVGAAASQEAKQDQAPWPTGREVVDRFIEQIGGADAVASIKSYRARGSFELTGQGIFGSLEMLAARPDRSAVLVDVPGVGNIMSGYDGTVGWTISPITGPEVLSGSALAQKAEDSIFDAVLHPPTTTTELTVVARTMFNGQDSYQVRVVFASGRERFEYYGVETGLQVGIEESLETPLGLVPSTTYLRDYRSFGLLKQATEIIQRPMGIEQVVRLTSFEYDVVDDDAFELPPAIKALIR